MEFDWKPTNDGRGLYCIVEDASLLLTVGDDEDSYWTVKALNNDDLLANGYEGGREAAQQAAEDAAYAQADGLY